MNSTETPTADEVNKGMKDLMKHGTASFVINTGNQGTSRDEWPTDIREETEEYMPETRHIELSTKNITHSLDANSVSNTRKSHDSVMMKDLLACDSRQTMERKSKNNASNEDYEETPKIVKVGEPTELSIQQFASHP